MKLFSFDKPQSRYDRSNTKNAGRVLQRRRSTGAVAVEFAVCAPLLFMLLFTCYEFARANLMQHAAESAAYEAARVGIIPGAEPDEIRQAGGFVLSTIGVRSFDIQISPSTITQETERVTVNVAVPFKENFGLGTFFVQDPTFRGTCTLNRERL